MTGPMKILIPMGGAGKRLQPLTWSKPKPLVSLAGKTVLDYVLEMFGTLPNSDSIELVFSINPYIEGQLRDHMERHYPEKQVSFPVDREMRGQSDAFWPARDLLDGPVLVVFADTIIEHDFAELKDEAADGVIWVKPVPDPRQFGVTVCDEEGWVTQIIEKPGDFNNNLAVVGCYYFKDSQAILSAIQEQIERKLYLKGEFYIAEAINILIRGGMRFRTESVDVWLDAGTPENLLATNRYLLDHGRDLPPHPQTDPAQNKNSIIIPPVHIHSTALIEGSVIGPHVSLGAEVIVQDSLLKDSIIGSSSQIKNSLLAESILGRNVRVLGKSGQFCLGDDSQVIQ